MQKLALWNLNSAIVGWILALLVFLVDLLVLPRYILAYRDSLELVTASHLVQAAHPPGYPLFVVLGKLLTLPLAWIEPVYTRYAVVNSLYGVVVVLLVYRCGLLLTGDLLLSVLTALALAWSYSFWFYRIIPEVFMMANLAGMVSLWLLLRWRDSFRAGKPGTGRWWSAFTLSLGLGLVCHQTTVLWWPGFAWIAAATAPRDLPRLVLRATGPFLVGLLPNLLVLLMAFLPHKPMWGNAPNLSDFLDYLLRKDYGGLAHAGPVAVKEAGNWLWGPVQAYLTRAWFNFGPLLLLAVAGLWLFFRPAECFLGFLPLTVLVAGPVFQLYGRYRTDSPFYLGSAEAFYLTSFLVFALTGLVFIDRLLPQRIAWRRAAAGVLAGLVLVQLMRTYPRVDRHDNTLSEGFTRSLLGRLPDRAVLVVSDDRDIFVAYYGAWVARTRPDLAILNYGFLHKPAYRAELVAAYPDLALPSSLTPGVFMRRFLQKNLGRGRPVYLGTRRYSDLWGCEGNPYFLRPQGKVFQVVRDNRMVPGDPTMLPFNDQLTRPYPAVDFWDQDLIVGYRLAWRNLGQTYTQLGLIRRARSLYDQLIQVDPNNDEWPAALLTLQGRPDTFRPRTDRDYRPTDRARHDQAAMAHIRSGDIERAIQEMETAVQLAPRNGKYANKLAVLLISRHDILTALPYARRAVRLEPGNAKYREDLEYVLSYTR